MSRALCLTLLLAVAPVAAEVWVEGLVERPGAYVWQPGSRLLDVLGPAQVRADAYLPGAAWLREDALADQRDLKAGILFDLALLERHARERQRPALAALARRLAEQVLALPVSGRRLYNLDPLLLETLAGHDRLLADGDRLLFPPRPREIRVTGAVAADCVRPFVGLRPAADYLRDCPLHADADPDWLQAIQPDGQVMRLGIAAWNRDPPQPLAPGAVLLVPITAAALAGLAETLTTELARFIATQPLPLSDPTEEDGVTEDHDETSGPGVACPVPGAVGSLSCPR